jgi:hypothetical protein
MVRATHRTTIEVTTEEHLTENGDCIVGVRADKGCAGLDPGVRSSIQGGPSKVRIKLMVEGETFSIEATGSPRLPLSDPHEIVIRKSDFVSGRTLALGADAAAKDIPRSMVARLRNPSTVGMLEVEVS